jgi:hypothetical protein
MNYMRIDECDEGEYSRFGKYISGDVYVRATTRFGAIEVQCGRR